MRNDQNALLGVLEHLTASAPPPSVPTIAVKDMGTEERELWELMQRIECLAPKLPPRSLREASLCLSRFASLSYDEDVRHLHLPGKYADRTRGLCVASFGEAYTVATDPPTDSVHAEMCDALSHARHASQVVTNMLDFAKLQAAELSLPKVRGGHEV